MVRGATGRTEALGHQQVVCFYSLFCNSEPEKRDAKSRTKRGKKKRIHVLLNMQVPTQKENEVKLLPTN